MKKIIATAAAAWCIATAGIAEEAGAPGDPGSRLTVKVTGIASQKGDIRIALYNSKKSYGDEGKKPGFRQTVVPVAGDVAVCVFDGLPPGEYAIKLYHDENANQRLDRIPLLQLPTEPYGFSNNALAVFGPPPFENAAFTIGSPEAVQEIALR